MSNNIFNKALWLNAFEGAVTAGLATFAGSQVFVTGLTAHSLEAAGIAAGTAALYQFVKALGGVQATLKTLKVAVSPKV